MSHNSGPIKRRGFFKALAATVVGLLGVSRTELIFSSERGRDGQNRLKNLFQKYGAEFGGRAAGLVPRSKKGGQDVRF